MDSSSFDCLIDHETVQTVDCFLPEEGVGGGVCAVKYKIMR